MVAALRRLGVDLDPVLWQWAYRCYPDGCPRHRTCCVGVAVSIARRERSVIDGLMDELARLVPDLKQADGYADVFIDDGSGIEIEPRDDDGTCPFLLPKGGKALCSIHLLGLQSGREVAAIKPRACRHWPLVLERSGRRVTITLHPSAASIGCIAPLAELPGQPAIAAAFASEIKELQALATSGDRSPTRRLR